MSQRNLKKDEKKLITLICNGFDEEKIIKHLYKKFRKPTQDEMGEKSPVDFLNDFKFHTLSNFLCAPVEYNMVITDIIENGHYKLLCELLYSYNYQPYNLNLRFYHKSTDFNEKQLLTLMEWLQTASIILAHKEERALPSKNHLYFVWELTKSGGIVNFKKEVRNFMKALLLNERIDIDFVVEWLRFMYDYFEIESFEEDAWRIIKEYEDIFSSVLKNDMELFNRCASLVMEKANKGNVIINPFYHFFERPNKEGKSAISLLEKEGNVGELNHIRSLQSEKANENEQYEQNFERKATEMKKVMDEAKEANVNKKTGEEIKVVQYYDFTITQKGRLVVKKENKIFSLDLCKGNYCYIEEKDRFLFFKEKEIMLQVDKVNFKNAQHIELFKKKVEATLMNENDVESTLSSCRIIENDE